jgi:hypothetical protein
MGSAEHRAGVKRRLPDGFDAEPGAGHRYRSPLSVAVPDRRNGIGQAIVDGQHPHNFIMGLGFHYVRELGGHTGSKFTSLRWATPRWAGGVSSSRIRRGIAGGAPLAPLAGLDAHLRRCSHRWTGVQKVKLEASGFHGAEPGENRWIIQQGAIDSWSTRLWFFPAKNWAAQVSVGRLDASGSAGAGRSSAQHGFARIHQTAAGRKLGVESDLGTQSRDGHGPQREFVSGGIGSAHSRKNF